MKTSTKAGLVVAAMALATPVFGQGRGGADDDGNCGGCNASKSEPSSRNDEERTIASKCGVESVDGQPGLYYAWADSVAEPASNRTTLEAYGRNSQGQVVANIADKTNLRPRNGDTLEQCAERAVNILINKGDSTGTGITTISRGPSALTPLR